MINPHCHNDEYWLYIVIIFQIIATIDPKFDICDGGIAYRRFLKHGCNGHCNVLVELLKRMLTSTTTFIQTARNLSTQLQHYVIPSISRVHLCNLRISNLSMSIHNSVISSNVVLFVGYARFVFALELKNIRLSPLLTIICFF